MDMLFCLVVSIVAAGVLVVGFAVPATVIILRKR
jgi:hypothetical protein